MADPPAADYKGFGKAGMLTFLLLFAVFLGCSGVDEPTNQPESTRPNVVMILVDTLRASNMSAYGYPRKTTPFIDSLLKHSVLFEKARSQASCTFPSVNSILTSRYASLFNKQEKGRMGIPDQYPTIAEILRDSGYRTIAVSASPIVRKTPCEHNPFGGFDGGFDLFDESCLWRSAACINVKVFDLLKTTPQPFFFYLHFMDPHDRYNPPSKWNKRWAKGFKGAEFIQQGNPNPIAKMLYNDGPNVPSGPREIAYLQDLYDEEIAFFDFQLKRLFDRFEQLGLLENTLFVLCSDHGEEFMEHNHVKHCRGLWDTLTHVPLIFRFPGVEGGKRVETPVQNIDIVPTLLDYTGIPAADFGFEGTSLRPLLEDLPTEDRFTYSSQGRQFSVANQRYKLVLDMKTGAPGYILYDLEDDPGEQVNIFDRTRPESQLLGQKLRKWLKQMEGQTLDKALEEALKKQKELRDLGYLQ